MGHNTDEPGGHHAECSQSAPTEQTLYEVPRAVKIRGRKQTGGTQGLGVLIPWGQNLIWGDEKILETDGGDTYTTLNCTLKNNKDCKFDVKCILSQ